MESNYYQVYLCILLEFLGYFQPRNATGEMLSKLHMFIRGKMGYSTFCNILTIPCTILHGILSKMNNL